MSSRQPESNWARAARYAVPFVLLSIPFWLAKINATVPEPYLDEVFHVRQAQTYWAHNWTQWHFKFGVLSKTGFLRSRTNKCDVIFYRYDLLFSDIT